MKKNSFLWAALSMTAALVMTACTSEDNTVDTPAAPQAEVKTIPYSVTVGQGGDATTRATVADDPSDATNYHKTLYFAAGDQLYISSDSRTDLKGTLTLKAGDEGKSNGATFEGSITYTGDAPEGTTEIKATLVGSSNVGVQITDGKVTGVSYPSDAYCNDVAEAVQKYSNLTGTSTYSSKSFTLTQQTAFLNFVITFNDGTTTGNELSAVVSNNSEPICTANVTTVTDNGVKAKFVLPVAKGTMLSSANVKFGDKAAISFGASQTLDGKVYNVTKTQATLSLTSPAVGQVIGSDGKNYTAAATLPTGVTKVAMIAYVSGSNGLAIALADEGSLNWETAKSTCEAKTPAFTNGTWKLPSQAEWNQMFSANGGDEERYIGLNSAISTAGGTVLLEGGTGYWSSTPVGSNAYFVFLQDGDTDWRSNKPVNYASQVRACLAFNL